MAYSVDLNTMGLDRMIRELPDKMAEVVDTTLLLIESSAKINVVNHDLIDTGFMMNSIHSEKDNPLSGRIVVGADYGQFHEFGTRYLPAKPFLGPAVDQHTPDMIAAAEDALRSFG